MSNIHRFIKHSSVEYLRSGDSHQSYDYLSRVFRPPMIYVLLDAYIVEKSVNVFDSDNISQQDATVFIDWCKNDKSDVIFQSMLDFWVLHTIPAFALLSIGERTNDLFVYDAGRRYLLPFIITNNMNKYTKIIMSELRRFQHEVLMKYNIFEELYLVIKDEDGMPKLRKVTKSFRIYLQEVQNHSIRLLLYRVKLNFIYDK